MRFFIKSSYEKVREPTDLSMCSLSCLRNNDSGDNNWRNKVCICLILAMQIYAVFESSSRYQFLYRSLMRLNTKRVSRLKIKAKGKRPQINQARL
jgi:hypothetical protein